MAKDHRYPTEVKRDAWNRATLANNTELPGLVREHGRFKVMGAACLSMDGKASAPKGHHKTAKRHASATA